MLKEDFIKLGLSEEQSIKAEEASKNELKEFVSKMMFDEVNQTKIQLEKDIIKRDKQLEDLNKSVGDNKELKEQIDKLQKDNKDKDEEFKTQIKEFKITTAINSAISNLAQDIDLVTGLFDKTKLVLSDDGKISGLEEQLEELKNTKPFLFKTGKIKTIYNPKDGDTPEESLSTSIAKQLNSENADNPYTNAWTQK